MDGSPRWVRVASVAEVEDGGALPVETAGLQLAIFHVGEAWYCTDNVCTHAFALLTDGWFENGIVECPLHAGQFDVRTGKGCGDPIDTDLKIYPIHIEGDAIMVELD